MNIKSILLVFSILFMIGNYQAQCTNATEIIKNPTCIEQTITVGASTTTVWLKFAPSNTNEVFRYSFSPLDGTVINDVKLHNGNNCSALTILTIYDSLNMNDSIDMIGLNTNGYYFLEFTLSNRKDPINLTFCKDEKAQENYWYYNFFINTPTGELTLLDCLAGSWPDNGPNGGSFHGVYSCDTVDVCINDTLYLELINHFQSGILGIDSIANFDTWFVTQNGTTLTAVNDSLAYMVFSQTGLVQFYCMPDTSFSTQYQQFIANYPQEFILNLNIVATAPNIAGTWINDNTICQNESATFEYSSFGYISSLQIDGITVPISTNTFTVNGANYSVGSHSVVYTVNSVCGSTTFSTSFTVIDDLSSFVVDNCGNATLTFTTCSPITTPPNQYYTINWGDGTVTNGTYNGNGFTVTHNFSTGTYTTNFINSYLPGGLGGIIFQDTFSTFTVLPNELVLTGSEYSCEITSPISINGSYPFSSIVWSTVPAGLPFTGQGTTSINPSAPAWASQNQDITVTVIAVDSNGCEYTGTWTLLECCKNPINTNEFFELTYYTHSNPTTGLQNKLPASSYNGPTNVSIASPILPAFPAINTSFGLSTTLSSFLATYAGTGGITVAGTTITINRIVYINNAFIIDQNATIINSNFLRFSANGSIVVAPAVTFNLVNSTLAPYCGEMWKGILHNQGNAYLNVNNSSIVGAIHGVKVDGNGGFKVEFSRFIDNYIGLAINGRNTTNDQLIQGNYFGDVTTQNLLFPYNTLPKTYSGISIFQSQNITVGSNLLVANVGGGNMFHNIQEGVRINQSKALVVRNTFLNINETLSPTEFGVGVHIFGTKFINSTATIGTVNTDLNIFYSCERGVRDIGYVTLSAQYNFFKDVKNFGFELFAFTTASNHNLKYNSLNSISNRAYGVYIKDFGNATNLVAYNSFNVNIGPALTSPYDFRTAIHLGNINSTAVNSSEILFNTINFSRFGIHVLNCNEPKIKSNTITMDWANSFYTSALPISTIGILAQNSPSNQIFTNVISHNTLPIGINSDRLVGIRIDVSPYSYVWKNQMLRMASGFYALGSNFRSKIECNLMQLNNQGFRMNNAYISRQGAPISAINPSGISAHNRWVANILTDGTIGNMLYPVGATPITQYYHNPAFIYNSDPSFGINIGSGWTDITLLGGVNTCGTPPNLVPIELETADQKREANFNLIAQNTPLFDSLDQEMRHYINPQALGALKHNPNLLNLGNASDAFYQNYVNSSAPNQARLQVLANDYLANKQADSAELIINQYANSELYNQLLKDVHTIWNNAVLTNTIISASDSSYLYSIACSDPLTNGSAVYVARDILDWDGTCPTYGNRSGEQEQSDEILSAESFSIYPVPNDGSFKVLASEKIQSIEIFDLNGKLIESFNEINSEQMDLNTKLVQGFYLISVMLESNKTETLRFVVE